MGAVLEKLNSRSDVARFFDSVDTTTPEQSWCPTREWVVGRCPMCHGDLVCMSYDNDGEYRIVWQCWGSLGQEPSCSFSQSQRPEVDSDH